jgi:hypothetical protein
MTGQLGQMPLDIAQGEALPNLVGAFEDVAGNELDGPDYAHGVEL